MPERSPSSGAKAPPDVATQECHHRLSASYQCAHCMCRVHTLGALGHTAGGRGGHLRLRLASSGSPTYKGPLAQASVPAAC